MKKFTFVLLAFFCFYNATAQWTTQTDVNTAVTTSSSPLDVLTTVTSTGETYVVFWTNVNTPNNIELRVQLLDVNGNPTLGANGMLLSDQIPMSTYTVQWDIALDNQDNLYIGVTGTGNTANEPALLFKLDAQGNSLWGNSGVSVGHGNRMTLLPLNNGKLIVSWLDNSTYTAAIQKFDTNGNALWATPKHISYNSSATTPAALFKLSDNSIIEIFHVLMMSGKSNLYAQKFDMNGNAQWNTPVQLSDKVTSYNHRYSHLQIGDTIYFGFSEATGFRFDAHLQRLNPDGTIPWGMNGVDFDITEDEYEFTPQLAHQDGSDYIWAIANYTDQSQGQVGEYVQKFNKTTGARLLSDHAKKLYPVGSSKFHLGELRLTNAGKPLFILASETTSSNQPTELSLVRLDSSGNFDFPNKIIPIATADSIKTRVSLTRTINNQNVAIFKEHKLENPDPQIYAQNYTDSDLSVVDYSPVINTIRFKNPIESKLIINSKYIMKSIVIYSITGRQIYQNSDLDKKQFSISSSRWQSGIYLMTVQTNKGTEKGLKIIKR